MDSLNLSALHAQYAKDGPDNQPFHPAMTVKSESASLLTTGTFAYQSSNQNTLRAESLREAMLKVIAQPQFSHPAFWAP